MYNKVSCLLCSLFSSPWFLTLSLFSVLYSTLLFFCVFFFFPRLGRANVNLFAFMDSFYLESSQIEYSDENFLCTDTTSDFAQNSFVDPNDLSMLSYESEFPISNLLQFFEHSGGDSSCSMDDDVEIITENTSKSSPQETLPISESTSTSISSPQAALFESQDSAHSRQ
jgi:hypothetical protein